MMEIDQPLQQRIVGAIVITALAAIFIPMLFDDPVEVSAQAISELDIPPSPEENQATPLIPVQKSVENVLALPEPVAIRDKTLASVDAAQKLDSQPPIQLHSWVIQVGSFGQRKNALELRDKLRKQGFSAFSEAYKTAQGQMLYRVRVGPELDKKRAETIQKNLDKRNQVKSILLKE